MSKLELSEHAHRILKEELAELEHIYNSIAEYTSTSTDAISGICSILNKRSRYFGIVGEHFSVQDFDGITVIDTLDECLVRYIHKIAMAHLESRTTSISESISIDIKTRMLPNATEMPRYPAGYRILHVIREYIRLFDTQAHDKELNDVCGAFINVISGIASAYIRTRDIVNVRHFSDVAREYDVVSRLKCKCGKEKFQVKLQKLVNSDLGTPYDSLDLECRACGHQRSVTFDLPHLSDLYQS